MGPFKHHMSSKKSNEFNFLDAIFLKIDNILLLVNNPEANSSHLANSLFIDANRINFKLSPNFKRFALPFGSIPSFLHALMIYFRAESSTLNSILLETGWSNSKIKGITFFPTNSPTFTFFD